MRHAICVILTCIFCFSLFPPLTTPLMCSFVNVKPSVSSINQTNKQTIQSILWSEKAAFKKPFRVSSTSRNLDSMPGTPGSTYTSYHDPASPNPVSCIINSKSRSNSLGGMARMDMELHGVGGNSNDSDDLGGSGGAVGKAVPKL